MRTIGDRHLDPATTHSRFLNYNTFLLPGMNIDYDISEILTRANISLEQAILDFGLSLGEYLAHAGRDAMEFIETKFNPVSLAEALHLDMGALSDFVSTALDVADFLTFGLFDLAEHLTFDLVLKFVGQGALGVLNMLRISVVDLMDVLHLDPLEFLVMLVHGVGKLVLGIFGVEVPFPFRAGAKPALQIRAPSIGVACGEEGYDIMAFSEVFDQEPSARAAILAGLEASSLKPLNAVAEGPHNPLQLIDSGLFRACVGACQILDSASHEFVHKGDKLLDTDAWATKGVLLTRIDVGVGVIDLYNMHLISGDDLLGDVLKPIGSVLGIEINADVLDAKRLAQVQEAVEFIQATHDVRNVAMLCGDTNIDAEVEDPPDNVALTAAYRQMVNMLGGIAMDDLFAQQAAFVPGIKNLRNPTHGPEGGGTTRFDGRCTVILDAGHPNVGFCDEMTPSKVAARIDYVFVERPRPEHTFELDFSRMRRMPFRPEGLPEDQLFLSDHIGQDIMLIASRSTH